ncbi:hypothetical protein DBT_0541 [Dissulfuribacter thermophilus]|uniref:Uncharacterized protein n=1 Tax=Dissulfuribacter thermophilus TaxID=1156395 RepID=A0A1B9F815_9BACT|nr:hypothetical protein DBT_0541 [Dissulfuribacter thermophilus]
MGAKWFKFFDIKHQVRRDSTTLMAPVFIDRHTHHLLKKAISKRS